MKVTKWIEVSQDVVVDIGADDIRVALAEAFAAASQAIDDGPNVHDILGAFQGIGAFLRAFTDDQIGNLNLAQRKTIGEFLTAQGSRFRLPVDDVFDS